jgi:hypothetical protein
MISQAQAEAEEFRKHFRAACLSLGSHCLTVEKATKLANGLGTEPHMTHSLDLGELDPYRG